MRADHAIAAGKRVEMASSNASTTAYLALLARKLAAKDYNPDVYVKEIAQRCVGGHELHQQRNIIKVAIIFVRFRRPCPDAGPSFSLA